MKESLNELVYIQSQLKAPKNQKNTFGGYTYRSCEDIMEAVKPILHEVNCYLILSDEVVQVADRIYVKATATLRTSGGEVYTNTAFAREPLSKKGQDESQITGATSSYARKYALNGLFCIDDNKDADTLNKSAEFTKSKDNAPNDDELKEAFELIKANIESAPSQDYLNDLHLQNVALHKYEPYRNAMNKRAKELKSKK